MKNNLLIIILIFNLNGCDYVKNKVDISIDKYFNYERLKRYCAKSLVDLYDLEYRILKSTGNKSSYFFNNKELNFFKKNHQRTQIFYSNNKISKDRQHSLKKEEEYFSKNLSTLSSSYAQCLNGTKSSLNCQDLQKEIQLSCFQKEVQLFTYNKILRSQAIQFFPENKKENITIEFNSIKNYLKNLKK